MSGNEVSIPHLPYRQERKQSILDLKLHCSPENNVTTRRLIRLFCARIPSIILLYAQVTQAHPSSSSTLALGNQADGGEEIDEELRRVELAVDAELRRGVVEGVSAAPRRARVCA